MNKSENYVSKPPTFNCPCGTPVRDYPYDREKHEKSLKHIRFTKTDQEKQDEDDAKKEIKRIQANKSRAVYRVNHSNKIKDYKAQEYDCLCGSTVKISHKNDHINTLKHIKFINLNQ